MEDINFLYTISNPISGKIFYVGVTENPKKRFYNHVKNKNTYVYDVISEIVESGLKPTFSIIGQGRKYEMRIKERDLVDRLYSEGHPLVNRRVNQEEVILPYNIIINEGVDFDKSLLTYKNISNAVDV